MGDDLWVEEAWAGARGMGLGSPTSRGTELDVSASTEQQPIPLTLLLLCLGAALRGSGRLSLCVGSVPMRWHSLGLGVR